MERYLMKNSPIEVPDLECPAIAPLVANVDKDPENEIIIASSSDHDFIYAFNLDGSKVPGWPLAVMASWPPLRLAMLITMG